MFLDSDLWIVPPASHSAWFSRLDWYLNWQMSRGLNHRQSPLAAELFRISEEHGLRIDAHDPLDEQAPLLVSGRNLVPAKACVVLPYHGDLQEWLAQAQSIASKLKSTRAQVFLPTGAQVKSPSKSWKLPLCPADFTNDPEVTT